MLHSLNRPSGMIPAAVGVGENSSVAMKLQLIR